MYENTFVQYSPNPSIPYLGTTAHRLSASFVCSLSPSHHFILIHILQPPLRPLYHNPHLPSCPWSASRRAVLPKPTDRSQTNEGIPLPGNRERRFLRLNRYDLRRLWSLHRQPSRAARELDWHWHWHSLSPAHPTTQTSVWISCLRASLYLSPPLSFILSLLLSFSSPSISVCICVSPFLHSNTICVRPCVGFRLCGRRTPQERKHKDRTSNSAIPSPLVLLLVLLRSSCSPHCSSSLSGLPCIAPVD